MSTEPQLTPQLPEVSKTGPNTAEGKARISLNALGHGLWSEKPVLPGESPEEWDRHREEIVSSLHPVGGIEIALAERVALCHWRLRRLRDYETAMTLVGLEEAADQLFLAGRDLPYNSVQFDRARLRELAAQIDNLRTEIADGNALLEYWNQFNELPDDYSVSGAMVREFLDVMGQNYYPAYACDLGTWNFLKEFGLPEEYKNNPFTWPNWTTGVLRKALLAAAARRDLNYGKWFAGGMESHQTRMRERRKNLASVESEQETIRERVESGSRRKVLRAALPEDKVLDRIVRLENHLSRLASRAMQDLRKLQGRRKFGRTPGKVQARTSRDSDGDDGRRPA